MCNLYNVTTTHEAIIQCRGSLRSGRQSRTVAGRLSQLQGAGSAQPQNGEREIVRLNWGMPSPPERVKGKADYGTTNIRRPNFGHWRQWLGIEHRCVVPATSFAEPARRPATRTQPPASSGTSGSLSTRPSRCSFSPAMDALAWHSPRQGRSAGSRALRLFHHRAERVSSSRSTTRRCLSS